MYRKVLPCPLRSQIKNVKSRIFSGFKDKDIDDIVGKETGQDHMESMLQSFLNERAVQKLLPERDAEIYRINDLITQLKQSRKEIKDKKEQKAYRRMRTNQFMRGLEKSKSLNLIIPEEKDEESELL